MYFVKENLVPVAGSYSEKGLQLPVGELGLSDYFVKDSVSLDFEMRRVQSQFVCQGQVKAKLVLTCGRCLNVFEKSLKCNFLVDFRKPAEDLERADEVEAGIVIYDGDCLPLGEELRQELECRVSLNSACAEDCKGLCSNCGVNLNESSCDCDLKQGNSAFKDLGKLLEVKNRTEEQDS